MSAKPKFTKEVAPVPAWIYLLRAGLFLFFFGFVFTPVDVSFPVFGEEWYLYVLMMRAGIVFVVVAILFRTFQVVAYQKGLKAENEEAAAPAADPLDADDAVSTNKSVPTDKSVKTAESVKTA